MSYRIGSSKGLRKGPLEGLEWIRRKRPTSVGSNGCGRLGTRNWFIPRGLLRGSLVINWHRCDRWWAQRYRCVYHQLIPDEPDDDDDGEDKKIIGPARQKKVGQVNYVADWEPTFVPRAIGTPVEAPPDVIPFPVPGVPRPNPLPQVAIGGGGTGGSYSQPPRVVFVPFEDPDLVPPGFPGVSPAPIPGGFPETVDPGFNPDFGLGGTSGSTPALIEGLGGPSLAFDINFHDAAYAAAIAVGAIVVTAAIARGANPSLVAAIAGKVVPTPIVKIILENSEMALAQSINESIDDSLLWVLDMLKQDTSPTFAEGHNSEGPQDSNLPSAPAPQREFGLEANRGSRPPLLFNAAARMEQLLNGITLDF